MKICWNFIRSFILSFLKTTKFQFKLFSYYFTMPSLHFWDLIEWKKSFIPVGQFRNYEYINLWSKFVALYFSMVGGLHLEVYCVKKCPNMEFFLVRIFPYLEWILKNTDYKKLRVWTFSTQWCSARKLL